LLTDRTRRRLWHARYGRTRHVQAHRPGELVCLDCFAQVIPSVEAIHCARFLKRILLPAYRKAGWKLQRVLTDHGSEFKGFFDAVCSELGVRHTRTKPRHCWTNGFVERLQGTIFHEHWRVAFRRRYFTSAAAVDHSLQRFLAFYNHQRPLQGYRLRGRTPADLFLGAVQS
jgi:transposase InsO family protein